MWRSGLRLVRQTTPSFRHFKARRVLPLESNSDSLKPRIVKSLVFTAASATVCYTGCSLILYEKLRAEKEKRCAYYVPKWFDRYPVVRWWKQQKPAMKLFYGILGVNGLVFAMWQVPRFSGTMYKYFAHSPTSNMVSPMLLSVFSHKSALHCGCNMVVLYSFIEAAVEVMGVEQFLATYLTGGVVSSAVSHFGKIYTKNPVMSIGASGAIMTAIGFVCLAFPDAQVQIIFLPMVTFKAITAVKGLVLVDTVGLIRKWSFLDHAAHLGGALYGIAYYLGGYKFFLLYSTELLKFWDKLRSDKRNR